MSLFSCKARITSIRRRTPLLECADAPSRGVSPKNEGEVIRLENKQNKVRLATGQIENVAIKPDRYAVLVGGDWYSAFEKVCPVSKGQSVAIAYTENGRWRDIKAIKVLEEKLPGLSSTVPMGFGPYERGRQEFMARCVGLKSAATFYADEGAAKSSDLVTLAEALTRWLLRDMASQQQQPKAEQPQEAATGQTVEGQKGVKA